MLECETTTVRPANIRSRITNNVRESLVGVDGRSERGRRYRDLLEAAIAEYGPDHPERLRTLAALKLSLEGIEAEVVRGDASRAEDQVRLGNLISRREKELRAKQRAAAASAPSLREAVRAKYAKAGAP